MDQIVDAFKKCRRETDFYRLQISVEDFVTPQEFAYLCDLRSELPPQAQDWLDKLQSLMFTEVPVPRAYVRHRLSDQVWFYGAEAPLAGRTPSRPHLLVCFCGLWQRLMSPISTMLQHIDSDKCDVVVLTDPSRLGYFGGIDGYAKDFAGILHRLRQDIAFDRYETVKCFGTSVGGLTALVAASRTVAERAVSVGGRPASFYAASLARKGVDPVAFCRVFAVGPLPTTRFICVYPSDHEADRSGAEEFAREIQAELVPVHGTGEHTLLFQLMKKGKLAGFLDGLFFSDAAVPGYCL